MGAVRQDNVAVKSSGFVIPGPLVEEECEGDSKRKSMECQVWKTACLGGPFCATSRCQSSRKEGTAGLSEEGRSRKL